MNRPAIAACVAALLLAACSAPDDGERLAAARAHLAAGERPAAIIELKSALQANPRSGEARYLLGKALLDGGDAVAASVELRKAAELDYDANVLTPVLASALVAEGEARRVVERWADTALATPDATAQLKTALAMAHARLEQPDLADRAVDAALAAQPGHLPALLLKARLAAARGDATGAIARLDEAASRDPKQADIWALKGELQLRALRDPQAARASFERAVALRPELVDVHAEIVTLQLADGGVDAARDYVAKLEKSLPDTPTLRLLRARVAFASKDYAAARDLAVPLVQIAPNHPILLQLAGAAQYQLGALPQAENLLAQAVRVAPGAPLASLLLARVHLRTGHPDKALAVLRPLLDAETPRADALLLAGEAQLQLNDAPAAEAAFARAAQLQPNSSRARTALALAQIGKGQAASGLSELETIAGADTGATADLALIASHLQRRDLAKALLAVDGLEKKQPNNPLTANLRGRIQVLQGDAKAARASFDRALALDPHYFPALASAAALDVAEDRPDEARRRLDTAIAAAPNNHRAMLAQAALSRRTGGADVRKWLERAVDAAPGDVTSRLQLIEELLRAGDAKSALAAAQDANTALPDRRELLYALAQAQMAAGDHQQAVSTFTRLSKIPNALQPATIGIADALVAQKDYAGAERHLLAALQTDPGLLPVRRKLAQLMTSDGRNNDALALARELQKSRPDDAAGFELEAEIEMQRRRGDAAVAAMRTALAKRPTPDTAARLHTVMLATDQTTDAAAFAAQWLKGHPSDAAFRFYLGDAALARRDWAAAEAHYRDVLRLQPDNALALNNVAWMLVKQGKPGALALAQRANTLLPNSVPVLDTLALALGAEQQLPRAIELQRKTIRLAPDDPTLKMTLARLYLQSGAKAEARAELQDLAKLGDKFRDHAEVQTLLAQP